MAVHRRCRRDAKCGQSLVELAVSLPILMLLMLGTLDLGRMFFDYIQLRGAVREGAAYGARFPTDTAGIASRVTSHGVPAGTTVTSSCTGQCTTIDGVGTMTVTASRTFQPVTAGFLRQWGLDTVSLQVACSMRVLS